MYLLIIGIGLIIEFEKIRELIFISGKQSFNNINLIVTITSVLTIILFILKKSKYYKSVLNFFSGIVQGLTIVFRMKKRNSFILHSIFIWLMYLLMFWVTSMAFIELHDFSFYQFLISFTLAALSIMLSNGGIGIYPLTVENH